MFPFFFDRTIILLIPALILAIYAQSKVRGAYAKFSKIRSMRGLTGAQVARSLLDANGLQGIKIEERRGTLTDHYDPLKRVLRLSSGVYRSDSIAAVGVAAHETGHAIQHKLGYLPLKLRSSFVSVANFGSSLALPLFLIGFLFRFPILMDVGIIFFSLAVLFHIVTLPVEFNASQRALTLLSQESYLSGQEVSSARSMLNAAAWTYVAATTMAVMQLVRLLLLRGSRE